MSARTAPRTRRRSTTKGGPTGTTRWCRWPTFVPSAKPPRPPKPPNQSQRQQSSWPTNAGGWTPKKTRTWATKVEQIASSASACRHPQATPGGRELDSPRKPSPPGASAPARTTHLPGPSALHRQVPGGARCHRSSRQVPPPRHQAQRRTRWHFMARESKNEVFNI